MVFAPRARSGLDRIGQTGAHAALTAGSTMPPLLARMLDKQGHDRLGATPYLPKDEATTDDGETS